MAALRQGIESEDAAAHVLEASPLALGGGGFGGCDAARHVQRHVGAPHLPTRLGGSARLRRPRLVRRIAMGRPREPTRLALKHCGVRGLQVALLEGRVESEVGASLGGGATQLASAVVHLDGQHSAGHVHRNPRLPRLRTRRDWRHRPGGWRRWDLDRRRKGRDRRQVHRHGRWGRDRRQVRRCGRRGCDGGRESCWRRRRPGRRRGRWRRRYHRGRNWRCGCRSGGGLRGGGRLRR
mmetsp:Transcript_124619/g.360486  ORF Transcript_124619/g.360486 Transcript_124619/m.360486 type:complete len:237 (-) Transcript_124619:676-1386(-)